MANNSLPRTKSLLFDITAKLFSNKKDGRGVTSAEVVNEFMKNANYLPQSELSEIMRHGLMVLAGRVTTMNRTSAAQSDFLAKEGLPLFVDLRLEYESGKFRTERFDVRKLTPKLIVRHRSSAKKNSGQSKREKLIVWANKQIEEGRGDVPVEKA